MQLSKEKEVLLEKIVAGIKKAARKLYEERAAKNETVIITVNGEIRKVPAKDLLKDLPS
jgi:hypothetical protein